MWYNWKKKLKYKNQRTTFKVSIVKISNFGLFTRDHFGAFFSGNESPLSNFKKKNNSNPKVMISHLFVT